MKKINYNEIVTPEKMEGAFINQEFIGFPEDYSVIHCLLKEWEPKNIFEIGTNAGNGCRVMRNVCPNAKIVSLDIVPGVGHHCPADIVKVVLRTTGFTILGCLLLTTLFWLPSFLLQWVLVSTGALTSDTAQYIGYAFSAIFGIQAFKSGRSMGTKKAYTARGISEDKLAIALQA